MAIDDAKGFVIDSDRVLFDSTELEEVRALGVAEGRRQAILDGARMLKELSASFAGTGSPEEESIFLNASEAIRDLDVTVPVEVVAGPQTSRVERDDFEVASKQQVLAMGPIDAWNAGYDAALWSQTQIIRGETLRHFLDLRDGNIRTVPNGASILRSGGGEWKMRSFPYAYSGWKVMLSHSSFEPNQPNEVFVLFRRQLKETER